MTKPARRSLSDLTKKEFNTLKASGMLWELYPEASDTWEKTQEDLRQGRYTVTSKEKRRG